KIRLKLLEIAGEWDRIEYSILSHSPAISSCFNLILSLSFSFPKLLLFKKRAFINSELFKGILQIFIRVKISLESLPSLTSYQMTFVNFPRDILNSSFIVYSEFLFSFSSNQFFMKLYALLM